MLPTSTRLRGYTLVEILTCIALGAMLLTLAVPNYRQRQTATDFAQARTDMQNIKQGLEIYRIDQLDYPWMNNINSALGGGEGYTWAVPTLERLTTPIPYLTNAPFYDPFQATLAYEGSDLESVRDSASSPYLAAAYKQYFYHARNAYDTSTWGQLNANQQPIWYLLESAGPDQHHHYMWQVLNGTFSNTDEKIALRSKTIYDPTNGSTSRGSIWEVGGEPQGTGSTFATAVENANSSHVSGWDKYDR